MHNKTNSVYCCTQMRCWLVSQRGSTDQNVGILGRTTKDSTYLDLLNYSSQFSKETCMASRRLRGLNLGTSHKYCFLRCHGMEILLWSGRLIWVVTSKDISRTSLYPICPSLCCQKDCPEPRPGITLAYKVNFKLLTMRKRSNP